MNELNDGVILPPVTRDLSADGIDANSLLSAVLGLSDECIKVLDLEGRLLFMSEGGKRVMEVDDLSTLKDCPWPDFWSGEASADAIKAVAIAAAGGMPVSRELLTPPRATPLLGCTGSAADRR